MATIHNEILINAPIEKIWDALTNLELLEKYDPTVKRSRLISSQKTNVGAVRRVDMQDGKNWFEEKLTVFKPNESLTFELTACSFPVHQLKHSYSFEKVDGKVKVQQVMDYKVKFGLLGKVMDALVVKKQSDAGVKKFFAGLKAYTENNF
jgi:ribosome-associated toxin RatA of RatAB toxin-antitoxin module